MDDVLVTGASGLVGGEAVWSLAARARRVWAVVRSARGRSPAERLAARLAASGHKVPPNVRAVAGDLAEGFMAPLPEAPLVDAVVHCAADTSFLNAAPPESHVNVRMTRTVLDWCRTRANRPLVVLVSTASVLSGRGLVAEARARVEDVHHNGYTRSKAAAEGLLDGAGDLPRLVVRPSIVLGAGVRDQCMARQILWFLACSRLLPCLPLDPDAAVDVVDAGFVGEAIALLAAQRAAGVYHLSAGAEGAERLGDVFRRAGERFRRRTPLRLVPPIRWGRDEEATIRSSAQRAAFRAMSHYFPFLHAGSVYDDSRLRRTLGEARPAVRPLAEYLGALLDQIRTREAFAEAACP